MGGGCRCVEAINPSTLLKSRKSAAEAAFVREAMAEDGAAMCEFYAWFEAALARGERITELTVDEHLSAARARRSGFVGLSFNTIAGFNANGAMPHYRATQAVARHHPNGRRPAAHRQRRPVPRRHHRHHARVAHRQRQRGDEARLHAGAQGHDEPVARALSRAARSSPMLDALARAPLWAEGIEFGHGTGHGVGYFLNVHEGPQSISKAIPDANMAMEPGMITSIEPGVYRPGQWGVRIENLVLNVPAATPEGDTFGEFLEFETLTLCPIDTRCIDRQPAARRRDRLAQPLPRHRARRGWHRA